MGQAITLKDLNYSIYQKAHGNSQTLSSYLEELDPTPEGSELDAYERLVREAGIITKSIPEKNVYSSKVETFYRTDENRTLFPEYVARTLIKSMREFPLYKYLIATRTPIDSNVYMGSYLDLEDADNKKALEMRRVVEATDLPTAKLRLGEMAVSFYKYGRAIEASYEAVRRMSLDLFKRHVGWIAQRAADNKVAEILDVIEKGDGNNNPAYKHKMSELDVGITDGVLTREAWIRFLLKFYPNNANTVIANEDGLIQILNVLYPKADVAAKMDELIHNGLDVKTTLPQGLIANTTLLYSPRIDKVDTIEAIFAIDRHNCIEELFEVGSTIQEADKFIKNQTHLLTISENSGFMKMFKESARILKLN